MVETCAEVPRRTLSFTHLKVPTRTRPKYGKIKAKEGGHATNATLAAQQATVHRKAGTKPEQRKRLAVRRIGSNMICATQQSKTPCNHLQRNTATSEFVGSKTGLRCGHRFLEGERRHHVLARTPMNSSELTLPASMRIGTQSSCTRVGP